MPQFVVRFANNREASQVVVEDDGRVAYAYLVIDNEIVGDVWLWNRLVPPLTIQEQGREGAPFLNPSQFCREPMLLAEDSTDISVAWSNHLGTPVATIHCRNHVLATVGHGDKPGHCVNATIASPLALSIEV